MKIYEAWEDLKVWLTDKPESIDGNDVLGKIDELESFYE